MTEYGDSSLLFWNLNKSLKIYRNHNDVLTKGEISFGILKHGRKEWNFVRSGCRQGCDNVLLSYKDPSRGIHIFSLVTC